jgi:hypothetical protein
VRKIARMVLTALLVVMLLVGAVACRVRSEERVEKAVPEVRTVTPEMSVPTSILTENQVTAIAENALQALRAGDYDAWSRDWGDTMKMAMKEHDFQAYRESTQRRYGQYVAISQVELMPGDGPGYIYWVITSDFERSQLRYILTFREDSDKIEALRSEPVK